MERIYLLEDDDSIRKLVIYALGSQGYEAQGFDRPSDFWSAMEGPQPALILLDIMLPEEDGLSILQKLRASAATKRIPVIMLTAKNTEYDRVVGNERGEIGSASWRDGVFVLVGRGGGGGGGTRDAIMDGVWGQEFSRENRTLDVHVRTLRTKLGAAGHYIETVRGVGYKIGGAS